LTPELLEAIEDEELLLMEPRSDYDACVLGIGERFNARFVVYDRECVMRVLQAEMSEDDAEEWFSFNILGAWVGDGTPGFLGLDTQT
jgi:hypothetical protein